MPLDGVVAMYLAKELEETLKGGRLDRIGHPNRQAIMLSIRADRQTRRLFIDANPQQPRIGLIESTLQNPDKAPHFLMILRKYLQGAILQSITCEDFERVFTLTFSKRDEMGDLTTIHLIAELMGRHSNIVLVNKDFRIIDAIRHIDSRVNRVRETLPAHPYVWPPKQDKLPPAEMLRQIEAGMDPFLIQSAKDTVDSRIVQTTSGFSPFLAKEVSYLADVQGKRLVDLSDAERRLAKAMFETLLTRVLVGDVSPTVYLSSESTERTPKDFHAFNLTYLKSKEEADSISEAIETVFEQAARKAEFEAYRTSLQKRVRNQMQKLERRIAIHAAEREQGEMADELKEMGDLIYTHLHQITDHTESLTAESFIDQRTLEIPLDTSLTPSKNAERYYKRYRKAKTKKEKSEALLKTDLVQKSYLESLVSALDLASENDDLIAIEEELDQLAERRRISSLASEEPSGLPGRPASKRRRRMSMAKSQKQRAKKDDKQGANYRVYKASTGETILVGRNNLQNDQLTLRDAAKTDLWLHVNNAPGSHVIVKAPLESISDEALLEAAGLAAWFSSLNKGGMSAVNVDYCPAGHVRKGAGQRPGQVIYDRHFQVRVDPLDPKTLQPDDAP